MKKSRIFLLEDDINLAETIEEYLEEAGFEVNLEYNGDRAFEKLYEERFDILLLDINVPSKNGFELLSEIRAEGDLTPAIFITSLNSIENLEIGYESGCDDYIRKPFELKELKFRVQTLIKRNFSHLNSEKIDISENIYFEIDSNRLYRDSIEIALNSKELKLLKLFLKNPNISLSHERIYEHLWSYDESYSESALRTYIKNIRKAIGRDKIVSLKRVGYRFAK